MKTMCPPCYHQNGVDYIRQPYIMFAIPRIARESLLSEIGGDIFLKIADVHIYNASLVPARFAIPKLISRFAELKIEPEN